MKIIADQLISNDSKKIWNTIKSYTGNSFQIISDGPVNVLWSDISQALTETPNKKAPGADGVTSEVWKLVMAEPIPTSPLAKLIQKIINIMYDTGDIPKFLEASTVAPVPK
ncbi:hypothetical protein AYI69_g7859 [Smittium culicis]|uniref:Uncharacterized protein n=1 Tax=Smittium culicis TaxID=133412 RepID=A0A1R1XP33_9FUNG|nr:hypothetical protein AYI69_g7859 [Smittium culicis]